MTSAVDGVLSGAIPGPAAASRQALPGLAFALLFLALLAVFGVCGNLLHLAGMNYLTTGGNALQKIHPGSYLALLAVLTLALSAGGVQRVGACLRDHRAIAIYVAASLLLLAYVTIFVKLPAAPIIDAWICAGFLAVLITCADERQRRTLQILVHVLLAANSAVGLIEFVAQRALIPIVFNDYSAGGALIDITYWRFERSQGLLGHPLISSLGAGMLAVAMFSQIAFDRATIWRFLAMAHALVALPAFGGRTSIAVTVVLFALISIVRLVMFLRGHGARLGTWCAIIVGLVLAPLVLFFAVELGLFNSLADRLRDDNGSAGTRMIAFDILFQTPFQSLILGDINHDLIARQVRLGSIWGVEVAWIAIILHFGLIATIAMLVSTWGLLRDLVRSVHPSAYWAIAFYILAGTSGTGLSSKTVELSLLVGVVSLLYSRRALGPAWSRAPS